MNEQIESLRKKIKDCESLVDILKGEVDKTTEFGEYEKANRKLSISQFNLSQLQKKLSEAEQAALDQAHREAVEAHKKHLAAHTAQMKELQKLGDQIAGMLTELDNKYAEHFAGASSLRANYKSLAINAQSLGLDVSDAPEISNSADEALYKIIVSHNVDGYCSRGLRILFDKAQIGGWIQSGKLTRLA